MRGHGRNWRHRRTGIVHAMARYGRYETSTTACGVSTRPVERKDGKRKATGGRTQEDVDCMACIAARGAS